MAKNDALPICASSIARTLLAIVLAVSLAPAVPAFAASGGDTPQEAAADAAEAAIADMISSGNYIEGEAIAVIRANEQPDTSAQAQQLAEVGKESVIP